MLLSEKQELLEITRKIAKEEIALALAGFNQPKPGIAEEIPAEKIVKGASNAKL